MFKRVNSLLIAAVFAAVSFQTGIPAKAAGELVDSGIDYNETVETIQNPGAGYTSTVWANCAPNSTKVYDPKGSIVLFFINIGQFSSGINGTTDADGNYTEGKDYDFDETFFQSWRKTFDNCRKNGCMIAVRFRYDDNGKANPEPATFEKLLDHVKQIKDSKILSDNADILAFVECGFIGKWGEQHGGKYTDDIRYKAKLLDAMLDAVPENVPVTVRTPDIFAEWAGIKRSQLSDEAILSKTLPDIDYEKALSTRVGMYDDGYMGSDSDLGTYSDREKETSWLNRVAENTYFGGEFSGNPEYAQKFDTYLPENAIPEMYKTHLSYINGNIFQLYKDYIFGEKYDVSGVDNSAYYGENVFQFIRDHLGYRFVLRKSEFTPRAEQGGELKLNFDVENTGFANPVFYPKTYLILEKDGKFYQTELDISAHQWRSCTTNSNKPDIQLPDCIDAGKWNIYLRVSAIDDQVSADDCEKAPLHPNYGIRFANKNVWNELLGANYMGSFEVTRSDKHGTNNAFYQKNSSAEHIDAFPLTFNRFTFIDGLKSTANEWSDDDVIISKDDQSVSLKADDKNIYLMAKLPDGAKAPVYNVEINSRGERYWLYYSSGGYIYFNHESYAGCECKWSGKMVEFKIPFEVMNLKSGGEISSLRVFLQDSGNSWKLMSDMKASNVKIPADFNVYSAEQNMRLKQGGSCDLYVKTDLPDLSFQWYHDEKEIEKAVNQTYAIKNADKDSVGKYSVKVKSGDIEKMIPIANVIEVLDVETRSDVRGDANCDGSVDMSDIVLIMQSLANPDKYGEKGSDSSHITSQGAKNGDVAEKNGITVNDALEIQKYLLGKIKNFI